MTTSKPLFFLMTLAALLFITTSIVVEAADINNFCMPPIATYKQDVYSITNHRNDLNTFTYQSITKYNLLEGKKRIDTFEVSDNNSNNNLNSNLNSKTTEFIFFDRNNQNQSYVYKIDQDLQCTCLNLGKNPYNIENMFDQCVSNLDGNPITILGKISIANLGNGLKVGENTTNVQSIFNIVPFINTSKYSMNSNYWWIISHNEYTNDMNANVQELTSTQYYDHSINGVNDSDFNLPSNCPPKDKCQHPR